MKRKCIACLSMLVIVAILGGCGVSQPSATPAPGSGSAAASAQGVSYPLVGAPNLTIAMPDSGNLTAVTPDWNDSPYYTGLRERTGVTLEFSFPSDFNLLFASMDFPDIIMYNFSNYPGGYTKAIQDGIIEPVNPYLETCAPDLERVLRSNNNYWRSITSLDGEVAGFPFMRGGDYLLTFRGLFMRNDWLKQLNLDAPKTPDELRTVLTAFKNDMGATAPFSISMTDITRHCLGGGIMTTPFNLVRGYFYNIDGKVNYGFYQNELKDVLEFLSGLYSDGLIAQNIATITSQEVDANFMGTDAGLTLGTSGAVGRYFDTILSKNPTFDIVGVGSLVKKHGDKAMSSQYEYPIAGNTAIITTTSKNKEIAAKYMNYNYTDEGRMYTNWGVEGVSYTMVNGSPKYTDLVVKFPGGMGQGLAQHSHAAISDYVVQDERYQDEYMPYESQKLAYRTWGGTDVAKYALPDVLSIPLNSVNEYSKLKSDIETYRDEMMLKFVTGIEPLSNFDTYMSTLKSIGIERYIELTQMAYDAYLKR